MTARPASPSGDRPGGGGGGSGPPPLPPTSSGDGGGGASGGGGWGASVFALAAQHPSEVLSCVGVTTTAAFLFLWGEIKASRKHIDDEVKALTKILNKHSKMLNRILGRLGGARARGDSDSGYSSSSS